MIIHRKYIVLGLIAAATSQYIRAQESAQATLVERCFSKLSEKGQLIALGEKISQVPKHLFLPLLKNCLLRRPYLENTEVIQAIAQMYHSKNEGQALLDRIQALVRVVTDPGLSKEGKCDFLKFLQDQISAANESICSPEQKHLLEEIKKYEDPLWKKFHKLLQKENVINCESFKVRHRVYKVNSMGHGISLSLKSSSLPTELTNIIYDISLLWYAIEWKSIPLIQALRLMGADFSEPDIYNLDYIGEADHRKGDCFLSKETTPLEHAIDSLDPVIVAEVLKGTKHFGSSILAAAGSRQTDFIEAPRSPFHRLIRALRSAHYPWRLNEHEKHKHKERLDKCKQICLLLRAKGLSINCLAHYPESTPSTMLDELCYLLHDFPEDHKEFMNWLVDQGAEFTGHALEIVLDPEEWPTESIIQFLANLISKKSGSFSGIAAPEDIKIHCAIIANDTSYLQSIGPRIAAITLNHKSDMQAIHLAAAYGRLEIFAYLAELDPGSLLKKCKDGGIALHYACGKKQTKVVKHILGLSKKGVEVGINMQDVDRDTPLDIVFESKKPEALAIKKLLIEHGARCNQWHSKAEREEP